MSNKIKLGLVSTVLCLVLLGITACSGCGQQGANQQLVTVTRGDISVKVSGSGKIEATNEASLTFGSGGKVDKINVKEGDKVKTGDVLARLDTRTLELALTQAQVAESQAEVTVTQAQVTQKTAEINLKNARDKEDTLNLAVLNAQINLDTARNNLSDTIKTYNWDTFQTVDSALNKAKTFYDYALDGSQKQPAGTGVTGDWDLTLQRATERLENAQAAYDNFLAGHANEKINLKQYQVKYAELSLTQAQKNLGNLADDIALEELKVTLANQSVAQARQSAELAKKSLKEAQRQLDEATIKAPFDGVIAQVNAEEGDNVPSPSVAPKIIVYMVDPVHVQLVVEVDEIDISQVALNQPVVITLDALTDAEFKGMVTSIYPVSKEEGGVVLYDVGLSLNVPEGSGIKVGMSASADIMIAEHSNVLMVPSRAIRNSEGKTTVKVMSGNQVQEKTVVAGLDDGLRTEIVSGLSGGETVVVESKTTTTSGLGVF